jgi:predicted RNase H-like HicB family nuclease
MKTYLLTIVKQDEIGTFAADVVGNGINGQGATLAAALDDAAAGLQAIIWHSVAEGEPIPAPVEPSEADLARGRLALLQATVPPANDVAA